MEYDFIYENKPNFRPITYLGGAEEVRMQPGVVGFVCDETKRIKRRYPRQVLLHNFSHGFEDRIDRVLYAMIFYQI